VKAPGRKRERCSAEGALPLVWRARGCSSGGSAWGGCRVKWCACWGSLECKASAGRATLWPRQVRGEPRALAIAYSVGLLARAVWETL
jgi:hypothetical protein